MPEEDVEQLLVSLILDNRIQGHIDQVNRLLERGDRLSFIFFLLIICCCCIVNIIYLGLSIVQIERNEEVCSSGEMEHTA